MSCTQDFSSWVFFQTRLSETASFLLLFFTYTCYLHVYEHTVLHALAAKRRKFLIILGTAVICSVRTVYVAAAQRSYLFLGFLAFLFLTSLKYFPGRRRFGCLRMCLCVFAHSFDSGSYPDKVEIMRTMWTVTNEHKWQASFWEKEGFTWDNSPTTCSVNVSFNQRQHLLASWIHIRDFFPACFFSFLEGCRVVLCLQSLSWLCVCVFQCLTNPLPCYIYSITWLLISHVVSKPWIKCCQALSEFQLARLKAAQIAKETYPVNWKKKMQIKKQA